MPPTNQQHTPGPIAVKKYGQHFILTNAKGHQVGTANTAADASLYAAAPDLLEAAKALLASPNIKNCPKGMWSLADAENYRLRVDLEAAIAKAEGR